MKAVALEIRDEGTFIAAVSLGRKFTGIESELKYFDIACERIATARSKQTMFT
jgi:DNA modification methylase